MTAKQGDPVNSNYLCRLICGAGNSVPVEIVKGDSPPKMQGESFYYTTPGGKPIYAPSAYKWPKVYHGSTLRIEVGEKWAAKKSNHAVYDFSDGVRSAIFPNRVRRVGKIRIIPGYASSLGRIFLVNRGKRFYHSRRNLTLSAFQKAQTDKLQEIADQAKEAWAKQDAAKKKESALNKSLNKVWVSVEDCLSAGLCMPGILSFASRKLRIKDLSLVKSHKISIPANRLKEIDGNNRHVNLAIRKAVERCLNEKIPA